MKVSRRWECYWCLTPLKGWSSVSITSPGRSETSLKESRWFLWGLISSRIVSSQRITCSRWASSCCSERSRRYSSIAGMSRFLLFWRWEARKDKAIARESNTSTSIAISALIRRKTLHFGARQQDTSLSPFWRNLIQSTRSSNSIRSTRINWRRTLRNWTWLLWASMTGRMTKQAQMRTILWPSHRNKNKPKTQESSKSSQTRFTTPTFLATSTPILPK